ncbi:MAG: universal stress protein [SAR202 cluster bacterium]|nr:universal stress protein [SAR202 cluster bacterium]
MFKKVLIPLDGTAEAEGVYGAVQDDLDRDCEVVLLHVVRPEVVQTAEGAAFKGSTSHVEQERRRMNLHLRGAVLRMHGDPEKWRCVVSIAESIPGGIMEAARAEGADLIAMYAPARTGLGKLLGGNGTAREVQRNAPCEVRIIGAADLAAAAVSRRVHSTP